MSINKSGPQSNIRSIRKCLDNRGLDNQGLSIPEAGNFGHLLSLLHPGEKYFCTGTCSMEAGCMFVSTSLIHVSD